MAFFMGMRYRSSQQDHQPCEKITKDVQHVHRRPRRTARFHSVTLLVVILVVAILLGATLLAFLSSRNRARANPAGWRIWNSERHNMRRTELGWSRRYEEEQAGSLESTSSSSDCIPSPLEERLAMPEYGCAEMEAPTSRSEQQHASPTGHRASSGKRWGGVCSENPGEGAEIARAKGHGLPPDIQAWGKRPGASPR